VTGDASEWMGQRSRPATVLMIVAVFIVAASWAFMLGSSEVPQPTWEPQTSGEPVQTEVGP
jgi:hypothetical protein